MIPSARSRFSGRAPSVPDRLRKWAPVALALGLLSLTSSCASKSGAASGSSTSDASASSSGVRPASDTAPRASTPGTDPFYAQAWHLKNTGQKTYSSSAGVAGYDLNVESVYNAGGKGSGITVMVADDGVESAHEDLHANLTLGQSRDYLQETYTQSWAEPHAVNDNHGTSVAGIIAAVAENSLGSRGVAPLAKLINANPLSDSVTPSLQITALKDHLSADFDIVNHSFGLDEDGVNIGDSTFKTLLADAATSGRANKGKIIVKAAGNSYLVALDDANKIIRFGNASLDGYNTVPTSVVVAAMASDGYPSSYSSPGSAIWVSAPGGEYGNDDPAILTTDASGCNVGYALLSAVLSLFDTGASGNTGCMYTSTFNGTSAATPMVSGVVALILEANPALTARDVKYILAKTARKVRPSITQFYDYTRLSDGSGIIWEQGWITNTAGFNFNNFYGFGLVDAAAAVALAKTYTTNLGTYTESGWLASAANLNLAIPDHSSGGAQSVLNYGTAFSVEEVQVQVTVDHPHVGDLQLELTSPGGTKSILINANNSLYDSTGYGGATFLSNAFYGEAAAGNWALKVVDGATGSTGTLKSWKMRAYGH